MRNTTEAIDGTSRSKCEKITIEAVALVTITTKKIKDLDGKKESEEKEK